MLLSGEGLKESTRVSDSGADSGELMLVFDLLDQCLNVRDLLTSGMSSRSTTSQEVNEILDSVLRGFGSIARILALCELLGLCGIYLVPDLLVLGGENASDRADYFSETHCRGRHNAKD